MEVQVVTITPELAGRLLDANPRNRGIKNANLKRVAAAMEEGAWKVNGDTIRVDTDGYLLDGQHRLLAVVASGISYEGILVTGLAPEVFDTIDQGVKRTPGDILTTHGVKNAKAVASTLPIVAEYLSGGRDFEMAATRYRDRLRSLCDEHSGVGNSLWVSAALGTLAPQRVAMAMHYLVSWVSPGKADAFFKAVSTGESMAAGDPPLMLRNRLVDNLGAKAKLRPWYIMALFIKAWNAYALGVKMKVLRHSDGEEFPSIYGLLPQSSTKRSDS